MSTDKPIPAHAVDKLRTPRQVNEVTALMRLVAEYPEGFAAGARKLRKRVNDEIERMYSDDRRRSEITNKLLPLALEMAIDERRKNRQLLAPAKIDRQSAPPDFDPSFWLDTGPPEWAMRAYKLIGCFNVDIELKLTADLVPKMRRASDTGGVDLKTASPRDAYLAGMCSLDFTEEQAIRSLRPAESVGTATPHFRLAELAYTLANLGKRERWEREPYEAVLIVLLTCAPQFDPAVVGLGDMFGPWKSALVDSLIPEDRKAALQCVEDWHGTPESTELFERLLIVAEDMAESVKTCEHPEIKAMIVQSEASNAAEAVARAAIAPYVEEVAQIERDHPVQPYPGDSAHARRWAQLLELIDRQYAKVLSAAYAERMPPQIPHNLAASPTAASPPAPVREHLNKPDGWLRRELIREGEIGKTTFDTIRVDAGIKSAGDGDHSRTYSKADVRKLIKAAIAAETPRREKAAGKWTVLLEPAN